MKYSVMYSIRDNKILYSCETIGNQNKIILKFKKERGETVSCIDKHHIKQEPSVKCEQQSVKLTNNRAIKLEYDDEVEDIEDRQDRNTPKTEQGIKKELLIKNEPQDMSPACTELDSRESLVGWELKVKQEPFIKDEPELDWDNLIQEPCGDYECLYALYAQHEMKQEVAVGPELLQRPTPPALPQPIAVVKMEREGNNEKTVGPKDIRRRREQKERRSQKGIVSHCCSLCNYKSKLIGHLKRHMLTHTDLKPFGCDLCPSRFKQHSSLVRHMLIHSEKSLNKFGEKSYICDTCNFSSYRKYDLAKHIETHSNEKPFACEHCSFTSIRKGNLVTHLTTHTTENPYSCKMCRYTCKRKHTLARHMRTHTVEKPYACEKCSFSCKRKDYMTVHMNLHINKKLFICDHCSIKCRQKCNLVSHMRRCHMG